MKIRNVIAYKHYFIDFVKSLPEKMQDKIIKTIQYVETLQMVPAKYLKHIEGTGSRKIPEAHRRDKRAL